MLYEDDITLYVTYPISNSYTTTWYPSPNTRIHSITMASIRNCLVNCFIRFCTPLHIYKNPTTIPFTWTTDNTTHQCGLALHHYSNPHNVNWCILFYILPCVVAFPTLLRRRGWFVVWCTVDPIEADVISFSKIHGQPCFYIDPLSIPRPQAMGETALVILEVTSPTTEKLSWRSSF